MVFVKLAIQMMPGDEADCVPTRVLCSISTKWGFGFMLHPEGTKNGRNKNSVSWLGLFNSYFWVDREAGIYGVFASQLLPTFDKKFVKHLILFEKEIYNSSRHWTNN